MNLDWKRQPILKLEKGVLARKTAAGRYPGWHYELVKSPLYPGGPVRWVAWFVDDSVLTRNTRPNGVTTRLDSGTYNQALGAVKRHHEHEGVQ